LSDNTILSDLAVYSTPFFQPLRVYIASYANPARSAYYIKPSQLQKQSFNTTPENNPPLLGKQNSPPQSGEGALPQNSRQDLPSRPSFSWLLPKPITLKIN